MECDRKKPDKEQAVYCKTIRGACQSIEARRKLYSKLSPITGRVLCAPYQSFTIHCKRKWINGQNQTVVWDYKYTYLTYPEVQDALKRLHLSGHYDFILEINSFLAIEMSTSWRDLYKEVTGHID